MSVEKSDYIARREERRQTPAKRKLEAEKAELLDFSSGFYSSYAFSKPMGFLKCPTDHRLIQRVVYGWDYYYCDDCEFFFEITNSGVNPIPKQHFPGYLIQGLGFFLRYFGGEALADAFVRPHADRGKGERPQLPPIATIAEHKADWQEMVRLLPDKLRSLQQLDMPNHPIDQNGLAKVLDFFAPKELTEGEGADGEHTPKLPGVSEPSERPDGGS